MTKHHKPKTKSIEKFSPWICLSSFSLSCFNSPTVIVVTATIKSVITTTKVTQAPLSRLLFSQDFSYLHPNNQQMRGSKSETTVFFSDMRKVWKFSFSCWQRQGFTYSIRKPSLQYQKGGKSSPENSSIQSQNCLACLNTIPSSDCKTWFPQCNPWKHICSIVDN